MPWFAEGAFEFDSDDIEAEGFSAELDCGADLAERGDFLEAMEVFGDAEAQGLRGFQKKLVRVSTSF
jgi:hypothetical protein